MSLQAVLERYYTFTQVLSGNLQDFGWGSSYLKLLTVSNLIGKYFTEHIRMTSGYTLNYQRVGWVRELTDHKNLNDTFNQIIFIHNFVLDITNTLSQLRLFPVTVGCKVEASAMNAWAILIYDILLNSHRWYFTLIQNII